jgi:hypothetical protein
MNSDKKEEHVTGPNGEWLKHNRETGEITGGWETLRKDPWSPTVRGPWGNEVGTLENGQIKKKP